MNFRYDSAELTPESRQILDGAAKTLRASQQQALEIGGHASVEGTGSYNQDLSSRRARLPRRSGRRRRPAVFPGIRESRPQTSNTTEPGRILNRRVELTPIPRSMPQAVIAGR